MFYHTAGRCRAPPKCRHCAGSHLTNDCQNKENQSPKCSLCTGPHPSNFKGCPKFKEISRNGKKNLPNQTLTQPVQQSIESVPRPQQHGSTRKGNKSVGTQASIDNSQSNAPIVQKRPTAKKAVQTVTIKRSSVGSNTVANVVDTADKGILAVQETAHTEMQTINLNLHKETQTDRACTCGEKCSAIDENNLLHRVATLIKNGNSLDIEALESTINQYRSISLPATTPFVPNDCWRDDSRPEGRSGYRQYRRFKP